MAITRLDKPIKLTSEEVDKQYDGRWVIFQQPNIQESGFVHAYSDSFRDVDKETHDTDYNELERIIFQEFDSGALLVHGCKNRGRMNLHVDFHSN